MFFLWIRCGTLGKGYYLPQAKNWSGHLHIGREIVGGARAIELPVVAAEGIYSIELPEGFQWGEDGRDGMELTHCSRVVLLSRELRLDIYVAKCTKQGTALRKFVTPNQPVTIGSKPDNLIQYEEQPVSRNHAMIVRRPDGTCQFTDRSRNGSYVNGQFCNNMSRPLSFGDRVMILPSLNLIYLGDCVAVSMTESVIVDPRLKLYEAPEAAGNQIADVSVVTEYHRAPRHVQQPKTDDIEIEAPLEKERRKELPTWLAVGPSVTMILPMMISTLVNQRSVVSSLAMIGTSSALAIMWGSLNRNYQKKQSILNEETRQQICRQYYAEMEERLSAVTERERKRLLHNYLSVAECAQLPSASVHRLWERMPSHDDFLLMRLGLGERELPSKLNVKPPRISMTDDELRHEPQRLYDQYSTMHDVPVLLSLAQNQIVGILGKKTIPWLMQSLVVQAAANHSYHDVRIVILHDEEDAQQWSFAKWLPHVYASDDRSLRMVVSEEEAVAEVLSHIDAVLSMRAEMKENEEKEDKDRSGIPGVQLPWYLIFCTDPRILEDRPIVRHLTSSGLGFTLILQTPSMELLPKECFSVIEAKERLGAVYSMDGTMKGVRFESTTEDVIRSFSKGMAPVRIKEVVEDSAIPSLVTFLESYNVRKVEDLDIRYYWNENHAYQSVKACLGLKAGSAPFVLDISDKNHGPHGLIAGTTGAGKSVLLQAFILSLAINYSPTEVQFILIDYKGGGTSEDFRTLPHAAGIIDSLQGERMIFRALASIKGEILRREEIFKRVGVNNIDDYMKFFNNDASEEPLGHLIIIVDEFAELKKEQPDFMRELVSAARVGRSLGMHLVLATQKPSNSVSDEIAANTRFRICLRVASKSDSTEMLKRPEAAYLKGMGRCYVQVGNDEVFEQVQTSFPGAAYSPNALRSDEEPRLLNAAGQPVKLRRKKSGAQGKAVSEMDAVLERINWACEQYHFDKARRMWLDELADVLYLQDIKPFAAQSFKNGEWQPAKEGEMLAYFGMADDVEKQRHMPVAMDFVSEKNQIIVGLSGMGKTTMLQTIAVSLAMRYSPKELTLYVFSLTSRTLSSLAELPHVGDIVYEEELDEQIRLMEMIHEESERRKKLFARMSTDNYIQYNRAARAAGGEFSEVPVIVVMVDRVQQLREWADQRKDDKLQLFYDMLRSASSQGIYFVLTAFERNELPAKYQSYVHGVALQLNERVNYADALGVRIPVEWGGIRSYPGRGMIGREDKEAKRTYIYEIQTAVYGTNESDAKRSESIRELGRQMRAAWKGALPKGIARIPEEPKLTDLLGDADMQADMMQADRLPAFYAKNTGSTLSLNLRECFSMLVCGPRKSGKTNFIKNAASTFAKKGAKIYLIGSPDLMDWGRAHQMQVFGYGDPNWNEAFTELFQKEIGRRSGLLQAAKAQGGAQARAKLLETFEPVVILIDDLDSYMEKNDAAPLLNANLKHFCADIVSGYGVYTIATLSHAGYQRTKIKEPVVNMARAKRGLMLQGKLSDCDPFDVQLPYNKKGAVYPLGEGLLITDQGMTHVVVPQWNEG